MEDGVGVGVGVGVGGARLLLLLLLRRGFALRLCAIYFDD